MDEKALFDRLPVGAALFRLDAEGYHALCANEELRDRFALSAEEVAASLSAGGAALTHPEDADRLSLMLYKGGVTGGRFSETVRLRLRGGGYGWTDIRLNAVPEGDGSSLLCFALTDVDAQKENELKLERTYEELLGVMNNAPGGIAVFATRNNREPFPVFVSQGIYRLLRATRREAADRYGRDFRLAVHPDDREGAIRTVEDALRNLSPFRMTLRLLPATGEPIWVDASGTVEAAESQRSIYMSFTDSSADRETQRLLQRILDIFVRKQYDNICLVDGAHRSYRILSFHNADQYAIPAEGDDYESAADAIIGRFVVPAEQERVRAELRLESLIDKLAAQEEAEYFFTIRVPSGSLRCKKLWVRWLDKGDSRLALVLSDYTELRERELEHQQTLLDALEAARQASVAKSVFLSRMSHDIRTPLNAIIGFTRISLDDPANPPDTRERLQKVASASAFLLSLINDVLDMSRIESGKTILKTESFSLSALLDDIRAVTAAQCAEKGLTFRLEKADSLRPCYIGDRLKLQQVLLNLLGNAVKFTPPGGEVSLAAAESGTYDRHALLRFTVSDTGIGISAAFLPHIFETFTQENSEGAGQTGTGLGLAICKSIVTLMDGSIRVSSRKGGGSVFTAEVRLAVPETEEAAPVEASAAIPAPERYDFHGRRVLLAEDNQLNQEIARYLLESVGIAVDLASDGAQAVSLFRGSAEGTYDALLLDIRMPVMDGIAAAGAVRALPRADAARVPMIAVSADAFEEDVSRSLSSGINAHLIKPIDRAALYRTLDSFWAKGPSRRQESV